MGKEIDNGGPDAGHEENCFLSMGGGGECNCGQRYSHAPMGGGLTYCGLDVEACAVSNRPDCRECLDALAAEARQSTTEGV